MGTNIFLLSSTHTSCSSLLTSIFLFLSKLKVSLFLFSYSRSFSLSFSRSFSRSFSLELSLSLDLDLSRPRPLSRPLSLFLPLSLFVSAQVCSHLPPIVFRPVPTINKLLQDCKSAWSDKNKNKNKSGRTGRKNILHNSIHGNALLSQAQHKTWIELRRESISATSEWALAPLFSVVPCHILLDVLGELLKENQLVVLSERLGMLSSAVLGLAYLLKPQLWVGPIIPLLPHSMDAILGAPVPFIAGFPGRTIPHDVELQGGVGILNLDGDNVTFEITKEPEDPYFEREKRVVNGGEGKEEKEEEEESTAGLPGKAVLLEALAEPYSKFASSDDGSAPMYNPSQGELECAKVCAGTIREHIVRICNSALKADSEDQKRNGGGVEGRADGRGEGGGGRRGGGRGGGGGRNKKRTDVDGVVAEKLLKEFKSHCKKPQHIARPIQKPNRANSLAGDENNYNSHNKGETTAAADSESGSGEANAALEGVAKSFGSPEEMRVKAEADRKDVASFLKRQRSTQMFEIFFLDEKRRDEQTEKKKGREGMSSLIFGSRKKEEERGGAGGGAGDFDKYRSPTKVVMKVDGKVKNKRGSESRSLVLENFGGDSSSEGETL